jgi:hypothetical protein
VPDNDDKFIIEWISAWPAMAKGRAWQPYAQYAGNMGKSVLATPPARSHQPAPPGGKKTFEVIGIPLRKAGLLRGRGWPHPRQGAAGQADDRVYPHGRAGDQYGGHFKHGAQSSLVWASLDKGAPVAQAQVAVRDCAGKLLWQGATGADGVAHIPASWPIPAARTMAATSSVRAAAAT